MKLLIGLMIVALLAGCGSIAQTVTPLPEPTVTAITSNADWTPVERDFDGVTMVFVPPGCFMMGAENGEIDQRPVARTCIAAPFWLDKTEVTQAQFVANHGEKSLANNFTGENRPVERITWFEADAYCQAQGGRLPTEAEWEFAARGADSLIFPWGNTFIADNVVLRENSGGQTADVGSRPGGKSWVGALDMVGNVWEWTASLYAPYPFNTDGSLERDTGDSITANRVLRGGAWADGTLHVRAAYRNGVTPTTMAGSGGFRCARSS